MVMELEDLVRQAARRDLRAFVELTRRFQHFAFGSALSLVHDVQTAEDVVQEAFLAAWSDLQRLEEPAAFPGWLRSIVRAQAFRVRRRKHLPSVPMAEAEAIAGEEPLADQQLERRQRAQIAITAIAGLPTPLREPASLFYVHDCSHQDIAAFLGLSASTVNNRLHAARTLLRKRIPAMVMKSFQSNGLPDDFANRIGRLIEACDGAVEVMFDPRSMPDLLGELAVNENGRSVAIQVVQRKADGTVRAVAASPTPPLARGATVFDARRRADTRVGAHALASLIAGFVGRSPFQAGEPRLLETGIKAIDLLCPLAVGGSVALAGEAGAGLMVMMEELTLRIADGADPLTVVMLMPPAETWGRDLGDDFSYAGAIGRDGFSERGKGSLQTFFLRGPAEPWKAETLADLADADAVVHLSGAQMSAGVAPAIEPATCSSRLLESGAVSGEHASVARRARLALASLRSPETGTVECDRASRLQAFLTQPFFAAEAYTGRPGVSVSLEDTLAGCRDILDGGYDDLPASAFSFGGSMGQISERLAAG